MMRAYFTTRLYVLALRAFPPRHRAAYAAEMIDAFEREMSVQRRRGPTRAVTYAVAATVNVLSAGLGERRRQRRHGVPTPAGLGWTDVRHAWRMLLRDPGLSLVSVVGMAIGIALATATFTIISALLDPAVPLAEGERVVSIVQLDAATTNSE